MTMRLASKTSLALVVYYLRSSKGSAEALAQQLQSILAALEVNVLLRLSMLKDTIYEAEATELHEQYVVVVLEWTSYLTAHHLDCLAMTPTIWR
jgi:hypothetical protein